MISPPATAVTTDRAAEVPLTTNSPLQFAAAETDPEAWPTKSKDA